MEKRETAQPAGREDARDIDLGKRRILSKAVYTAPTLVALSLAAPTRTAKGFESPPPIPSSTDEPPLPEELGKNG